jgi:hypothetical protein
VGRAILPSSVLAGIGYVLRTSHKGLIDLLRKWRAALVRMDYKAWLTA